VVLKQQTNDRGGLIMRFSLSVAVALIGFALFAVSPASARGGGGGGFHSGQNSSSARAVMRDRQQQAKMAAVVQGRHQKTKNVAFAAL
jgi:hypothetical protein